MPHQISDSPQKTSEVSEDFGSLPSPMSTDKSAVKAARLLRSSRAAGLPLRTFAAFAIWCGGAISSQAADRTQPVPLSPELRTRCVQILRDVFHGDEFWPAMHAAEALTLAGHGDEVVRTLKPKLETESDHQRRCGLVREMCRAGDRSSLPRMWATLADVESNGRVHAAESLYKIREVGDRKLLQAALVQTENPKLQLMAAAALGRVGDEASLKLLQEHLSSSDRELRKIAGWVLGLLGQPSDIPALQKTLDVETDPVTQAYFVNALACLGDEMARVQLGKNLKSADFAIRTYSAEFAGYSRSSEFRELLISLLDDAVGDVRARAAQSLITLSLPPAALGLPLSLVGEDWPQFRGINASGVSQSTKSLPVEFSTTEKLRWSAKLGDGVGCPIVVGGRTIATGMTGEQTFSVFAFDAATGLALWRRDFETGKLPRITPPNSHASSTPASDGQRVYVHFSTLGLVALDNATGELLWQHKLPVPAYLMDWGAASSPIVHDGVVIYNQDDDLSSALYGIDAATGTLRWRTERPEMLAGYSIPVLCTANGQTDVVLAGSGKMKGYDPATGHERWACNSLLRTAMTSPVERDGVIYFSCQSYGDETRTLKFALLEWLDTNQDGELARVELPQEFWPRFDRSDKDRNAVLKGDELDTAFQSAENLVGGGNTIQAIRGGGTGDVTATHVLWNLKNKSPSNLVSPLVVGTQLFIVKKGGLSSSFDVTTGGKHWELSRIRNIGDYYASPIAGDGKIYVTGENGFVVVLEQGPELKILARNDVGESCIATPAIAHGRLFVRGRETLFCFAEEGTP